MHTDTRRPEEMTAEDCLQVLVESGTVAEVPLDQAEFRSAMLETVAEWKEQLGGNSKPYFLAIAGHLADLLESPGDWRETGRFLLHQVREVYGNGSHQFVCQAVPSLFKAGHIQSRQDLQDWVGALVETVNPMGTGEHLFSYAAQKIESGVIDSIESLRGQTSETLQA